MEQDTSDKMLMDPQRGFIMVFFARPEIEEIDVSDIVRYVAGTQCGRFQSPDGYDCSVVVDQDMRMILMTGIHDDGHVMIRSEYRPLHLAEKLSSLPADLRARINAALKGHLPDSTPLMKEWARHGGDQADYGLAESVIKTLPFFDNGKPAQFTAQEAFGILQAEYGVTHAKADRPVLASFGAGPCVILSIFNEKAHTGLLAHVDDAVNLDHVSQVLFDMRKTTNEPLTAHMVGGWGETHWMVADIAMRLAEQPNITLAGWRPAGELLSDAALNTRNGHVSLAFQKSQVDPGPRLRERDHRIMASYLGSGGTRPLLRSYEPRHGRRTAELL